jgi:hypothetical protein
MNGGFPRVRLRSDPIIVPTGKDFHLSGVGEVL